MKTKLHLFVAEMLLAMTGTGLGQLPIITTQPQSQTNFVGATASFTVVAAGTGLTYQWQQALDYVNFLDRPEATASTLVITNVQTGDSGYYRVVVTNLEGSITSSNAQLYVLVPPTLTFSPSSYSVAEGAGNVTVTVRRTGYQDSSVAVDYATADLTATNGIKYTAVSGTLVFGPGESTRPIGVPILNEGSVEGTKIFRVLLSNPTGGAVLGPAVATVNITDNDGPLRFGSTTYTVSEEAGSLELSVCRGDDGDYPVTVDFITVDGTAVAGTDYQGVTNTLHFGPRETMKLVPITILNDAVREPAESFRVTLSNPTGGGQLGPVTQATVSITDTDETVQLGQAYCSVSEAADLLRVCVLRGESSTSCTVDLWTADGTAKAGLDYVGLTNTLDFAPGERSKSVDIPIVKDGLKEAHENFRVILGNPTGGTAVVDPSISTVTILDNDAGLSFDRSVYAVSEHEGALTFRVLRGNDVQLEPFTVDLRTEDITASGQLDYVGLRTNLAFAQGETAKTITLEILPDAVEEGDEQFRLVLTNFTGVSAVGTTRAQVYLFDSAGFTPHKFDSAAVLSGGSLELTLGGRVTKALLTNDFDLYPIEVSTNLLDWSPWVTLQRTNAVVNLFTCQDPEAASSASRFYRTPSNHFVTPFPKPPGPFPVGVVSRLVADPTRHDRYPALPGEARFMVSVWYPAVAEGDKLPARLEDEIAAVTTDSYLTPRLNSRRYLYRSSAQPEVACAADEAPYPIYVYSPGGWGSRTHVAERGPFLASYGYIVIASDPLDATITVFPDGTALYGSSTISFTDRVRDLQVILDELAHWNTDDPLFRGRLAVANVATGGHSYGAGAAAEICRIDPRCRAFLSFEGYFQDAGTVLGTGLSKPMLALYAGSLYDAGSAVALHNKATRDSTWFQIQSTVHTSFCDYYWALAPAGGREAAHIMNTYTLWFLNKYLKGRTDPMPALTDYPRVINFSQK